MVEDAAATGVRAVGPHGPLTVHGQVILACGGYEGNSELLARYHGEKGMVCRPVARGGHYNKGEGIEMALRAGAATAGNFALFHAEPIDPRSGEPEAAIFSFSYGILVNADGRRFVDEAPGPADAWYERITRVIQAQPRGLGYLILDAAHRAAAERPRLDPHRSATDHRPRSRRARGRARAAGRRHCARRWPRTTPRAGRASSSRPASDGLATEGLTPPKSNWARPLAGPFHAYPIMAANVFTFGGLRTDEDARVLDRDGRAIPGLFAAGELTGLYYSNYTGSTFRAARRGVRPHRRPARCPRSARRSGRRDPHLAPELHGPRGRRALRSPRCAATWPRTPCRTP